MRGCAALLFVLCAATALAQPMSITASAAVTWVDRADAGTEPAPLAEISMGSVHHPAVVVVWRGRPGWMFKDDTPETANTLSFCSSGTYRRTGEPIRSVSARQGAVRLELAYEHSTREARVNGILVVQPAGGPRRHPRRRRGRRGGCRRHVAGGRLRAGVDRGVPGPLGDGSRVREVRRTAAGGCVRQRAVQARHADDHG